MEHGNPQHEPNTADTYGRHLVPAIFTSASQLLLHYAAVQPGERVLDVACGTGIVARQVAMDVGQSGRVAALDLNPDMLRVARSMTQPAGPMIEWQKGNAESLPYPDHSFDLVVCQHGLQFFADKLAALREMRRVLASGGRVALNVQQSLGSNRVYDLLNQSLVRHLGIPAVAESFSFGDAGALHAMMVDAGFQQAEVIPATHIARFPNVAIFVHLSLLGSGEPVPELALIDAGVRAEMLDAVERDLSAALAGDLKDGRLEFQIAMNVGRGSA
jgi:ubiquinone/menaquinone biosynthesis C-methylase UbiE